ncbi:Ribokinase-like protein [Gorgonomyces haynaldii]|nr:Ribokinase-like protein [Gorgonomyces haynaldii]
MDTGILVVGSINIDVVYTVRTIAAPGETVHSLQQKTLPGGKGANQAAACAKAGGQVYFCGRIGRDGRFISDMMSSMGINLSLLQIDYEQPTGRAIIQVSKQTGENAIILSGGTNFLVSFPPFADVQPMGIRWILLQNEINQGASVEAIEFAKENNALVCLNPSPCTAELSKELPFDKIHALVMNQIEAETLLQSKAGSSIEQLLESCMERWPGLLFAVITVGPKGAYCCLRREGLHHLYQPVPHAVKVVDTTGAGDTFLGYLISSLAEHPVIEKSVMTDAMQKAVIASSMACELSGGMVSIPNISSILLKMND